MKTWSLERVIGDAVRAVKGTAALVFAPALDVLYPPADWSRTDAYRDERRAYRDKHRATEPTPKVCRAHREKVCIFCDEDSDALWMHPADGAEESAEREAEEEVSKPLSEWEQEMLNQATTRTLTDEDRERIAAVRDFVPGNPLMQELRDAGWEWTPIPEPQLSQDELVAVRGLIQERYEIDLQDAGPERVADEDCVAGHPPENCPTNFAGAAASLADGPNAAPSAREDKQRDNSPSSATSKPVDPQSDSPARGTGQAVTPPAACPPETSAHPPAPDSPAGGPPQLAPAGHPKLGARCAYCGCSTWTYGQFECRHTQPAEHPTDRADYLGPYHAT